METRRRSGHEEVKEEKRKPKVHPTNGMAAMGASGDENEDTESGRKHNKKKTTITWYLTYGDRGGARDEVPTTRGAGVRRTSVQIGATPHHDIATTCTHENTRVWNQ